MSTFLQSQMKGTILRAVSTWNSAYTVFTVIVPTIPLPMFNFIKLKQRFLKELIYNRLTTRPVRV